MEVEERGENIHCPAAVGKVTRQDSLQLRSLLPRGEKRGGTLPRVQREAPTHVLKASLSPGLYKRAVNFPKPIDFTHVLPLLF